MPSWNVQVIFLFKDQFYHCRFYLSGRENYFIVNTIGSQWTNLLFKFKICNAVQINASEFVIVSVR